MHSKYRISPCLLWWLQWEVLPKCLPHMTSPSFLLLPAGVVNTLPNISHLGERKIIFKNALWWDMLVPRKIIWPKPWLFFNHLQAPFFVGGSNYPNPWKNISAVVQHWSRFHPNIIQECQGTLPRNKAFVRDDYEPTQSLNRALILPYFLENMIHYSTKQSKKTPMKSHHLVRFDWLQSLQDIHDFLKGRYPGGPGIWRKPPSNPHNFQATKSLSC